MDQGRRMKLAREYGSCWLMREVSTMRWLAGVTWADGVESPPPRPA